MAAFEYKALGADGKKTSGIINADTKKQARSQLKKQGLFPTEVKEQQSGKATSGDGLSVEIDFSKYFERVSSQELAEMTNQMETLIRTSVSIDETLAILADQTENNMLRLALVEIKDKVTKGLSLSEAMKDHPKIFDKLYISLIEVGQETGQLDEILGRLREHTGKMVELQQKVIKAISYPLLTMLISGGVVLGIFVGVIPRIRKLFDTFGATLPLPTQIVLAISDFLLNRWYIPLALVIIIAYSFPKWINTENGRYTFDSFKLKIPYFGNLFRMISTSRFSRTLATLLKGGLPLAEALPIAKNVLQNVVLEEVVEKANQNIISGKDFAEPLLKSGQFPPLLVRMIAVGERTGEMEHMLIEASDAYDQRVDTKLNTLASVIEPFMMVGLGGIVLLIGSSVLLPLLNMSALAR
jgi:general secretion pathway protein F